MNDQEQYINKEEFLKSGLLEQYILNLTGQEETEQVEQMLVRYPEIQQELDDMNKAIVQYAMSHSIAPPPHLKHRGLPEMDDIEKNANLTNRLKPLKSTSWIAMGNSAALIALCLISTILWIQNRGLNKDTTELQQTILSQRSACEEQLQQATNQPFAFLSDPSTRTVILKGTNLSPEAEVIVYWNPEEQAACLNMINLPVPPVGKQYQIWADVEGKMIDMGLINRHKGGIQPVNYIAKATSFNITLEPNGGSEHPTVELLQANGSVL